jgi:threonine dehydratase
MIDLAAVRAARDRITDAVVLTPCVRSETLSNLTGLRAAFKLEGLQHTGSFKVRGALNRILQLGDKERRRGVLAFSAGNHAQGVAWAARQVGVEARVVMPRPTPLVKVSRTRALGAEVERYGETFAEAETRARELLETGGAAFIHPFDDEEIIAGQGTIGLEILEQQPQVEAIVCPVGGGGLISGIATAVKALRPDVRIFGVQTETAPAMRSSRHTGRVVPHPTGPTLAEGIAVKTPAELTLEIVRRHVEDIVLVSESAVEKALFDLLNDGRIHSEGAAAAAYAALGTERLSELRGASVVVVLSGANIDLNVLGRVIERAQVHSGRLARLAITLGDRPGALAGILKVVGDLEANVVKVQHERSFSRTDLWQVEIELVIETRDESHRDDVIRELGNAGYGSVENLGARSLQLQR